MAKRTRRRPREHNRRLQSGKKTTVNQGLRSGEKRIVSFDTFNLAQKQARFSRELGNMVSKPFKSTLPDGREVWSVEITQT